MSDLLPHGEKSGFHSVFRRNVSLRIEMKSCPNEATFFDKGHQQALDVDIWGEDLQWQLITEGSFAFCLFQAERSLGGNTRGGVPYLLC